MYSKYGKTFVQYNKSCRENYTQTKGRKERKKDKIIPLSLFL